MSDSRPSSRGGRRGANGTSARSNTSSSANTSSLAKNKTFTSLKPEEKKQVEHVKELKPEWSDDQLIEFCGKYNYDANTIQQGLENIFEDAARENVDEWTQVKKKASAKPKSETPSAPSQSSSAAPGPRGASAGRGRGAASTGAPSTRGASATRGGAAPRGGRGGPRPSTNAQSKPDAESGAWAHAAAGAGWGDNSNTAQATVTGTATVSQGVPATGVPPVVVPPNPFTGKDSFLDRLMARDRAKENEKLAAQQAAQKEKEDKERSIREAEERKIREAQEAEDRKIREAQEAQRRLEDEERQRQEAEARAQAEAQAAAEAAAAAQAAQEEEARRQAEEAARQQQAALEAEQAAQAMAALQLKQQQEAAAQAAQSAQADDQVLSPIGARGSGFGNKAPGSAWRKAKEETVVQPAYTAAEFQAAEQSSVSALYSPEDPVILPQHLKDQTSAFDAPISFGTFNLPRKTDTATSTTPSFNQSLVSPQEPANRFAQDAQTATTPQAAPSTQTAAQTQAGDQSDALHQQPSTFMQFPGGMPPNALGQRSGYEDPQMYNQFYPYMMPPQNFGGMPGYDESQGFFDPAYSGYGRDGRKQAGGIVPGGGRGNRNFRQGGFPGAGLGPNPVIGLQGKDDKSKLGQQGPVQGVQPSKFSSSPPSGAQPQSVSPPPQNDQSPNSAQNGPQAGTPPNFGPVSAAPSAIPNAGSSFDKSRNPKLPRAGGAYQPKTNNFNKGPAGPAAQTFNGGGKQQGTYQNKKQFGGAAGPSTFNKKSQSFTPSQPQAAGQFQNPNPYYPYNPYYAAPYYGQYPPGFGRGGFYNPQQYGYPPYGGHQSPTFEENYDKNMAPYAGYDASQGQDYSQWGPNSQLPMGQDDGSFAAQGVQAPPSPSAEQNKQQGLGGGMDDRLGAAANPQIGGGRQMGRFQPQQGQQPQAAQQQQYGAMPLNLGQQQYNYSVPHQAYPAQGYGYQQPASDPNQQQQYWQS